MEHATLVSVYSMDFKILESPLLGVGLYTPREASVFTGISVPEIQRWLFGYRRSGRFHPGLWSSEVQESNTKALGFHDLLEIRFVHAFRQHHVSLQAIRKAAEHARDLFGIDYPFTCRRFQTDGRSIFATVLEETGEESLVDMVNKQHVFKQIIGPSLYEGIDYSESGSAKRWHPMKRSRVIVLDPERNFGKPILSRSGMDVAAIASAVEAEGDNTKLIAQLYEIPIKEVEVAVQFVRGLAA